MRGPGRYVIGMNVLPRDALENFKPLDAGISVFSDEGSLAMTALPGWFVIYRYSLSFGLLPGTRFY